MGLQDFIESFVMSFLLAKMCILDGEAGALPSSLVGKGAVAKCCNSEQTLSWPDYSRAATKPVLAQG